MHIEIMDGATVINTILADETFAEQNYPGAWRVAAVQPSDAPVPQHRHISVGAFFDRFGALKWAILADQTATVKAVVQDAAVRKYIDLDRADLPDGLQVLITAGHAVDVQAILTAPIQPQELP
ncbi:hypothetical protein [Ottowia sp.]|uniref:hypothetical protein n=1 Tax=Ottowia sp. TaxID=1898956 RepID=UPI0026001D82|nr:hypothetical protein [Ottowia sp.]